MRARHLTLTSENDSSTDSSFKPMRYLILFFAFLSPIALLAQDEGTVEYSVTTEVKVDMETAMANLPEGMEIDSAMVARMAQTFEDMPSRQDTSILLLHYSSTQALMEMAFSGLSNPFPSVSPFGSFDNTMGITTFFDYEEQTTITKFPGIGENVPYVISAEFQNQIPEWVLVDADSTILDYAVKKAEFISDSLKAVAWYAPGIESTAGPNQFFGLPGLLLSIDAEMSRPVSGKVSFVAKSLKEGLEEPIIQPIGISVTREEYMTIMSERIKIMRERIGEGVQFVP
jgi:GLPGLI family protein